MGHPIPCYVDAGEEGWATRRTALVARADVRSLSRPPSEGAFGMTSGLDIGVTAPKLLDLSLLNRNSPADRDSADRARYRQ
jgi:hypothetical protein